MKMAPRNGKADSTFERTNCDNRSCKGATKYDYDLIVIGGGSGGLAAAKEASALGAIVAVLDFVTPTPKGTKWDVGGTCVNVGCIPKKLMHQAAMLGEAIQDSRSFGWQFVDYISHNWNFLKEAVQSHIKSANREIKLELTKKGVHYINASGSFKDPHTIIAVTNEGDEPMTAKYILIATGTRPKYPDIPGAQEYGITSDDLFSLEKPPGRTLIVGADSNGLETAGFLHGLGYDVTVMNRTSVVLRRFDQQMAGFIVNEMEERGVKFLYNCQAKTITKSRCPCKSKITWTNDQNEEFTEDFNTIIFAVGRSALTKQLNLENASVEVAIDGEKIDVVNEQTNVPHIYAVGGVLYDKPELTPIAIQAGTLLSRRLFGGSTVNMDYEIFAVTVLTPLEYGTTGLSEETAISRYGEDNIEVYHAFYKCNEFFLPEKSMTNCYVKVIALREGAQKILGMHFMGPFAGEVVQGFMAALKCGLTVDGLLNTVGVHTTNAEEFTKLSITKRSGLDPNPAACCS